MSHSRALPRMPLAPLYLWLFWLSSVCITANAGYGFQSQTAATRCVLIEFYYDSSQASHAVALDKLNEFAAAKAGFEIVARSVHQQERNEQRLEKLAEHFKFDVQQLPALYTCNRIIHPNESESTWKTQLEDALVLDVYTRVGCSRCTLAKNYLAALLKRYPAFTVRYREITQDVRARNDLEQLAQRFRSAATSTPVFHFMDSLVVGFDSESTSGPRLENILKKWTVECKPRQHTEQPKIKPTATSQNKVSEVTNSLPF